MIPQTFLGLGQTAWAIVLAVAVVVIVAAVGVGAWPGRAGSDDPGPSDGDAWAAELRATARAARSVAELTHYELEYLIRTELARTPWVRTDAERRRWWIP